MSLGDELLANLRALPDEKREELRRIVTGEADEDLIRRGDVLTAIRSLRTNPVPSREVQAALTQVLRLVHEIPSPNPHGDKE